MPRGIYDRSKMTKKASKSEKISTGGAATPKRKYTRKASAEKFAAPAHQGGEPKAIQGSTHHTRFYDLQQAINVLTNTRQAANSVPLNAIIDPVLTKAVQAFGEVLFPVENVKNDETVGKTVAVKNGSAPVASAPVPFNPPTFAPATTA